MPRASKLKEPVQISKDTALAPDLAKSAGAAPAIESAEKMLKKAGKGKKRKAAGQGDEDRLNPKERAQLEKDKRELSDLVIAHPQLNEILQQDSGDVAWVRELDKKTTNEKLMRARVLLDGEMDAGLTKEALSGVGSIAEWMAGGSLDGLSAELGDEMLADASRNLFASRVFSRIPGQAKLGLMVGARTARVYSRNKAMRNAAHYAATVRQATGPHAI